jgi:hypothetical protein
MQGLLWATGGLYSLVLLTRISVWATFETYWAAPVGADTRQLRDWIAAEDTEIAMSNFSLLGWFATFVLLVIWSNQSYKAAMSHNVDGRTWSSKWAVGGWFIPAANLVIPKLVLNETERISAHIDPTTATDRPTWQQQPLSALGVIFWISLVGAVIFGGLAGNVYPADFSVDELRGAYVLSAISAGCAVVASVTGALFVRRIGKRLATAHTQVPDQ